MIVGDVLFACLHVHTHSCVCTHTNICMGRPAAEGARVAA